MVLSVEYSDSTLTERPSTAKMREVLKNLIHSGNSCRKRKSVRRRFSFMMLGRDQRACGIVIRNQRIYLDDQAGEDFGKTVNDYTE